LRLRSKGRYGSCVGGRSVIPLLHTGHIWALSRCSMIRRYKNSRYLTSNRNYRMDRESSGVTRVGVTRGGN